MATPDDNDPPSALPRGTRLGEFELRRVLGIGGFGIVYLAFDHALEREVAVKEYMPSTLVGRTDALQVSLLSQSNAESFSLGLRSFVNEARLLARFDHPSLVKVHRYWEANNTAYMAMPYYTGRNLHAVRRRMTQPPDEAWLRRILDPLLGAIERLHREGVYHRDISPDNVILEPDGRPVLLDFGAARRVLGDKSLALTAILKPAYAPIEQYAETGNVRQGPWTDLYALGATLHFLLLGRAPAPATTRTVDDEMPPLADQALPGCSVAFLQCIDWMLRPRPADRPQSVAALRQALDRAAVPAPAGDHGTAAEDWPRTQVLTAPAPPGDAPTVIDPSLQPATLAVPPAPQATVVLTRQPATQFAATAVMAPPAQAPATASPETPAARTEPSLQPGDPAPARPSPPPPVASGTAARQGPVWRWPLLGGAAAAAGLALWLGLKPPPTTGEAPPVAAAASATGPGAAPPADTASMATADGAPATSPGTAEAPPAAPPLPAPISTAAASPGSTPARPAVVAKALPKGLVDPGGSAARPGANAPGTGAPPGLATSITRLPPAAEPAAAPGQATAPTRQGIEAVRPMPSAVAAPPSPAPVAAPAPAPAPTAAPTSTQAVTTAPRATERDPEPVVVQARALSPSERCEGRMLLALWTCIERQCKNDAALRDHPECVKLRREQEQRNAPLR